MSAIYCDGFDTYTTLNERWVVAANNPAVFSFNSTLQRTGPACLAYNTSPNNENIRRALGAGAHATITVQFALYRVAPQTVQTIGVTLYSGAGTVLQTSLCVESNGTLTARRGDVNGTLLGTAAGNVTSGVWHHIGFKTTLADTGAAVQVWQNENLVINLTNQDTRNSGTDAVYDTVRFIFPSASSTIPVYLDDIVILNGAGSVNNTYLGDRQVLPRLVVGAGDRTELTPYGSATNYLNVDEARHDSLEYNGSATNGAADLYTLQDVPASSTINFVQQVTYAGKNEVGSKSIAPIVKSAGTEYPQAAVGLTQAFNPLFNIYETDPATSAAWTAAGFNAAQMGAEVRA